jgi:hypothetical protein
MSGVTWKHYGSKGSLDCHIGMINSRSDLRRLYTLLRLQKVVQSAKRKMVVARVHVVLVHSGHKRPKPTKNMEQTKNVNFCPNFIFKGNSGNNNVLKELKPMEKAKNIKFFVQKKEKKE